VHDTKQHEHASRCRSVPDDAPHLAKAAVGSRCCMEMLPDASRSYPGPADHLSFKPRPNLPNPLAASRSLPYPSAWSLSGLTQTHGLPFPSPVCMYNLPRTPRPLIPPPTCWLFVPEMVGAGHPLQRSIRVCHTREHRESL
jgi:hypothetical protein